MVASTLRITRASRLASRSQRLGRIAVFLIGPEQDIDFNAERASETVKYIYGRVHNTALNAGEVGGSYPSINGKRLLRQTTRRTKLPNIPSEARTTIHVVQAR